MDTIGDMLSRIRNAQLARHEIARVPASRLRLAIADLLVREGYIMKVEKRGRAAEKKLLEIFLKYENDIPVIREIKRISKPGRRWYAGKSEIWSRRAGRKLIISTPKGIMTDREARKANLGGEVLFEIW